MYGHKILNSAFFSSSLLPALASSSPFPAIALAHRHLLFHSSTGEELNAVWFSVVTYGALLLLRRVLVCGSTSVQTFSCRSLRLGGNWQWAFGKLSNSEDSNLSAPNPNGNNVLSQQLKRRVRVT